MADRLRLVPFAATHKGDALILSSYRVWLGDLELGEVHQQVWDGTVSGQRYHKWLAWDARGKRVGIHFATRRDALRRLVNELPKRQRRGVVV